MSPDTLSLNGKVAIITGSGKENGIGAGIASTLARNGASVVINYVSDTSAPRAAEVAQKIENAGGRATVVQADVSTQEGAKKLVEASLKAFQSDKVDILVNNAGGGPLVKVLEATKEEVEKTFAINTFASLYMTQAVVPVMPRGGRIINIGSIASKLGVSPIPLYSASKAAGDALSYAMAMELGRGYGITINTVAPGPVPTDGLPKGPVADAVHNSLIPMTRAEERMGTVDDIADAVLLLASEKSRWITGQFISASGGITGG
ncbi:putative oxidoreductase [Fonsecaea pedrosoi]|nr:putative oxidoreductase [Fonsecaea pedrosoi]